MSEDFKLVVVPTIARKGAGRPRTDRSPYRVALQEAIAQGAPADIGILLAENEPEAYKGNKTWQNQGLTIASRKNPDGTFNHYVQLFDESKVQKRVRKPKTNGEIVHEDGTTEVPMLDEDGVPDEL